MAVASTFAGFPPEGIQFMADLAANNDRAWFQPRKGEYERLVKEPMELLMVALAERFEARGIPLVADPKRDFTVPAYLREAIEWVTEAPEGENGEGGE